MQVHDCLPGGQTVVDADIPGVRAMLGVQPGFELIDQAQDPLPLGLIGIEPRLDMAPGNHQRMAGIDGGFVGDRHGAIVLRDDAVFWQTTKRAIHGFGDFSVILGCQKRVGKGTISVKVVLLFFRV